MAATSKVCARTGHASAASKNSRFFHNLTSRIRGPSGETGDRPGTAAVSDRAYRRLTAPTGLKSGSCFWRCVPLTHIRDPEERKRRRLRQSGRDLLLQSFGSLSAIRRRTGLQFNCGLRETSCVCNSLKTLCKILVTENPGRVKPHFRARTTFRGTAILC